jgi:hypothetical protein
MFTTKPRLFSIETISIFTPMRSKQLVNLISSIGLNLIEHVTILIELISILPIQYDQHVKIIFVLPI